MYFKDSLPVITCTNTENIASSRFSTVAAVLKKSPPLGKVQNWAGDLWWVKRTHSPGFAHGYASGNWHFHFTQSFYLCVIRQSPMSGGRANCSLHSQIWSGKIIYMTTLQNLLFKRSLPVTHCFKPLSFPKAL